MGAGTDITTSENFRINAKGQVSVEFLIIMGFALLMSIPLIFIFYKQSESLNSDVSNSQIEKIASEIRDAADEVYYLGAPSKKTILVYMPGGVDSVSFSGSSMVFNVSSAGGRYELVKWSGANFSSMSSVSEEPGIRKITVEARIFDVLVTSE